MTDNKSAWETGEWPSPQDLIDYLRQPDTKKARKFLIANHGGRCCIGHYAALAGIDDRIQAGVDSMPYKGMGPAWPSRHGMLLPDGHWMWGEGDRAHLSVAGTLANLNDRNGGFEKVIAYLEKVQRAIDEESG